MIKKILLVCVLLLSAVFSLSCSKNNQSDLKTAKVERKTIVSKISAIGIVIPRNRLAIKPQISGRAEQIFVKEGDNVKKGQLLLLMSSIERATLIDSARAKGEEELRYWEDVFKPTPIVAPIDGFIINRQVEPGQSISPSEPVLVMADKLIVKAQVDETDISKIKIGQQVKISLDAYPDKEISGKVEHIAYESTVINNVNIYEVDIIPTSLPKFFRAGMSANAKFILSKKENVLALPSDAIRNYRGGNYVLVKDKNEIKPVQISAGDTDGEKTEVLSGLNEGDIVIIPNAELSKKFFPASRRGNPPGTFGIRR